MLAAMARPKHVRRIEHIALTGNLSKLNSSRMRVSENTLQHLDALAFLPEFLAKVGNLVVKADSSVSCSDERLASSALAGQQLDLANEVGLRIADCDRFA